eukprot:Colp12_sorted_trinity150504_noHs@35541
MGQTLSEPVTEKHTSRLHNGRVICAASGMQGWRINMEDAHCMHIDHKADPEAMLFGVFDGHGGASVALYAGEKIGDKLFSDAHYQKGEYEAALKSTFLGIDSDILNDATFREPSGATAVVALVKDGKIYCANAGDSRCVVSCDGLAVPLSYDHKPMNESEYKRIFAAGGFVDFGRVNGNLALSRAIGDFEFKNNSKLKAEEQIVTANPDIIVKKITNEEEFIILACDGIWDVMSNQDAVSFVRKRISQQVELEKIAEELMDACLAPENRFAGGVGCDNMTVLIVAFTPDGSYAKLAERCSQPARQA